MLLHSEDYSMYTSENLKDIPYRPSQLVISPMTSIKLKTAKTPITLTMNGGGRTFARNSRVYLILYVSVYIE